MSKTLYRDMLKDKMTVLALILSSMGCSVEILASLPLYIN